MKADVQYNDFTGTASADISDFLGTKFGNRLEAFGKYFKINTERFTVIGISIYGTEKHYISLLCVDLEKSIKTKEHIISMSVEIGSQTEFISFLFKRLHIVLHSKFDEKYPDLDYDEEGNYEDYHTTEENEE